MADQGWVNFEKIPEGQEQMGGKLTRDCRQSPVKLKGISLDFPLAGHELATRAA